MYARQDSQGHTYLFTEGRTSLAPFSQFGDANLHDEAFRTVASWTLDRGEGVAFGRGTSHNPDRAEAYLWFDARSDDADADGTPDKLAGQYKLVVLNPSNDVVDIIDRGRLEEVRNGNPDTDDRGSWGVPFPYKALQNGNGEVLGGGGYQIGIQIELDSGTDAFNLSNSSMVAEGYRGSRQD